MSLIKCPECGKEISEQSSVCVGCGFPIHDYLGKKERDEKTIQIEKDMFKCKRCGFQNDSGCGFCANCGNPLVEYDNCQMQSGRNESRTGISYSGYYDARDKREKTTTSRKNVAIILIVAAVAIIAISKLCGGSGENSTELSTESNTLISSQGRTTQENVEDSNENDFLTDLEKVLDDKIAQKVDNILKNEIGFSDLEYIGQIDGTTNYEISADGYDIVVTASDDVYRVFIPNSSYTFYEDGKVKMAVSELEARTIDSNASNRYYIMAQEIVENCLKNPKSADFPSIVTHPEEIAMQRNGDIVAVQSYVDATNSFGATIRSKWLVEFKVLDLENYSYEILYINMDGETSGEYVELD